jgi:hypothetical protein
MQHRVEKGQYLMHTIQTKCMQQICCSVQTLSALTLITTTAGMIGPYTETSIYQDIPNSATIDLHESAQLSSAWG